MKLQKKLFILAVLLMAASMVFAQTSMTSHSTQELFGTDVDDFMNVNEWQNVKPKNIFGFLGYGSAGNGDIELGLAHQFKPFYLGTYFEGRIPGWKRTTSNTTTIENQGREIFNGKLLFGFGNIGILTDAKYESISATDNKTTWDPDTKTKSIKERFNLDFKLHAGINLNSNNKVYKITPKFELVSKVDKEAVFKNGKLDKVNRASNPSDGLDKGNEFKLTIGAEFSHDFSKKDGLTQTVMADLNTDWMIYQKTIKKISGGDTTKTYGKLNDKIVITPKYQLAYEPEGKFAFKAEAGLQTSLGFTKGQDYTSTTTPGGTVTKNYDNTRIHTTTFELTPSLKAAFTYAPISKFRFNVGLGFSAPSMKWETTKTDTRNTGTGTVSSTNKSNNFIFKADAGTLDVNSGFTWFITENATFDLNWDLMTNVFDKFSNASNLSNGDNLWVTINKLLIHDLRFAVSVKF